MTRPVRRPHPEAGHDVVNEGAPSPLALPPVHCDCWFCSPEYPDCLPFPQFAPPADAVFSAAQSDCRFSVPDQPDFRLSSRLSRSAQ